MNEGTKAAQQAQSPRSLKGCFLDLVNDCSAWQASIDSALTAYCSTVAQQLNTDLISIWLLNDTSDTLSLSYSCQRPNVQHYKLNTKISLPTYPDYQQQLQHQTVIAAHDINTEPSLRAFAVDHLHPFGIQSALHIPLRDHKCLLGILRIETTDLARTWTVQEIEFARAVASLMVQHLTQAELKRSVNYYQKLSSFQQAIFESSSHSIIACSKEGTILSFNRAASEMLGYQREEVIGKFTPEIIHDPAEVLQRAQVLSQELGEEVQPGFEVFTTLPLRGQSDERQWTYIHKDGSRIPVLLSVNATRDCEGEVTGFMGIAVNISELIKTQRALRDEEERYRKLFESASDSIFLVRHDQIIDCNLAAVRMFGYSKEDFIQLTPTDFSPEKQPNGECSKELSQYYLSQAAQGITQFFEWRHKNKTGFEFDAEVTLNTININNQPHVLGMVRDISKHKSSRYELERSRQQLLIQNQHLQLINRISTKLQTSHSNGQVIDDVLAILAEFAGAYFVCIILKNDERDNLCLTHMCGSPKLFPPVGSDLPAGNKLTEIAMRERRTVWSLDCENDERIAPEFRKRLGEIPLTSSITLPLIFQNTAIGVLGFGFDKQPSIDNQQIAVLETIAQSLSLSIANDKQLNSLQYMANHDSLTGLANRALLHTIFANRIKHRPKQSMALMLLDLDRFKEVNDTLGHHVGDQLLQEIGPRLRQSLTGEFADTLICRLGGDEFTLLVSNFETQQQVINLAKHLLEQIRHPYPIENMMLEVDASLGLAFYPDHGQDSHELLRSADVAMYSAKKEGFLVTVYNQDDDIHTPERLALITALGSAIRTDQLTLHYQPKIDLNNNQVLGFEALVRWQHPELGLLYPDRFIPLAEVSEVIHPLTSKVLDLALAQQQRWQQAGHSVSISVNLSARNLVDDHCVHYLSDLLQHYQTPPGMLELEITETALMQDPERAIGFLQQLSELGITLSIDDYGTGYSSLAYIRQLPIDSLKIDRAFVVDMVRNEQDAIIVNSTIGLAHNLKLRVIAEGVEDKATLTALRQQGCDMAQGYFIGRPLGAAATEDWLNTRAG